MKSIATMCALALASTWVAACDPPAGMSEGAKTAENEKGDGENKYAKEKEEEPVTPELEAKAANVKVLENASGLGCATEVLGLVDVHEPVKTVDQALRELRLDAARLDAQAVVGVEFHHGEPGEEPTHLSGQAVRCNDLIKGRTYDVIGDVEVTNKMGDEEGLYRSMKAKAKSLGADLIVDVEFEHGEGGDEPLKLKGKAIRFSKP
jgi:uncharacterized protein YbjQ (UPF0145 family)